MSLQSIREQKGMTRRTLAEQSGVNFRSIQDYEQGHKKLSSAGGDTLLRLAAALGCQIEELLWDVGEDESSELLPQNDVSLETILAQRFYCEKYQTYGRCSWETDGFASISSTTGRPIGSRSARPSRRSF